ncbi:Dolichol phosphate-mannose mannosyltransferase [Halapricum desulfuricans]|uniref:Dolichol phosphate-mannose mannosyltransferase n=1 Tax=Halapricum desulfuricans TaxID=2841257 RepID=A0A897NKL1_9EURY|nr:hypothetical protein [Halapricum desulfuricans]QSG12831.1 Dolichol phosphate-mannose mannosyltransferase [Halapricum desulfuricans]
MTDVRAATESLLEDRPDLETALEELLAVDAEHDTWTFEDVPFDSGTFGELVSRDIVEKTDGEYRLRDRAPSGDRRPGYDRHMIYKRSTATQDVPCEPAVDRHATGRRDGSRSGRAVSVHRGRGADK